MCELWQDNWCGKYEILWAVTYCCEVTRPLVNTCITQVPVRDRSLLRYMYCYCKHDHTQTCTDDGTSLQMSASHRQGFYATI